MDTLASGAVNQTVIADITNEMETLKSEIESLKCRKPPKDFTFDCVSGWLEALKANPDEKAIHLLIERIDVKSTTDIRITSTLTSRRRKTWLRELDLNQRPSGYEPDELPNCSIPAIFNCAITLGAISIIYEYIV